MEEIGEIGVRQFYVRNGDSYIPVLTSTNFSSLLRISLANTRDACERPVDEWKRRPLKHFKDGNTLWIPSAELEGYPFVRGTSVYHYKQNEQGEWEKVLCEECTFTQTVCQKNREAQEIEL